MFDWSAILTVVFTALSGVLAAFAGKVWRSYVRPWIEEKGLYNAAMAVIRAIEAEFGRGGGEAKWGAALIGMDYRGFDTGDPIVLEAMRAAWLDLDMDQVASGVKESPVPLPGIAFGGDVFKGTDAPVEVDGEDPPVEVTDPPDVG